MKRLFFLAIVSASFFLAGCSKDEDEGSGIAYMQPGIYAGRYDEGTSGTTIFDFQIVVTRTNDTTYQVQQISNGIITPFNIVIGAITGTGASQKIKFKIPRQASGATTLVGDARVPTGYDGQWSVQDNSFKFGYVFDNDQSDYVRFTGNGQ